MAESGKWLQELWRHNWQLKLLALLMALVTYYAIRAATGEEADYKVPVEVEVEPGVAVLALDPEVLNVRFRGSLDDLLKLDQERLKVRVRVRDENVGGRPQSITVTPRDIVGARGVSVVMVDPQRVVARFDHEVEAMFAVSRPETVGEALLGKVELQYEPRVVTVRGPQTRIAELKAEGHDQVVPDPIDVDGRVESFSKRVAVRSPGGNWASKIDPAEITVQVNVIKKSITRAWPQLPVLAVLNPAHRGRVVLDPPAVDVTVEGRSELLENVSERDIRVFVDAAVLDTSVTSRVPVQVHLPVFMDVTVTVVPRAVQVSFPQD